MWLKKMEQFFERKKVALTEVLDAAGCREGWLQGELFREFRAMPGFMMNEFLIKKGETADIACAKQMAGELKSIGADYSPKCITGGALRPFLKRDIPQLDSSDSDLNLGSWGLVPDYFRLLNAPLPPGGSRLLILVADVQKSSTGSLATALRTIDFAGTSARVELPRGFVRIWDVAPRSKRAAA